MKNFVRCAVMCAAVFVFLQSCKKDPGVKNSGNSITNPTTTTPITPGTDPAVASTQGFFLDNWTGKTFTAPATVSTGKPSAGGAITTTVDVGQIITKVSNLLFGNNTNPYMGQYITEPVLMNNLTSLAPHILRAPGGGLSDLYFWNADGTTTKAPADAPATLLNNLGNASAANYWYGNNSQTFTITLDNYYKVLQQTNSTGLITVNYGYARYGTSAHPDQTAAHLAANWVRYDKGRTQYWEVGNEVYGNFESGYRIDISQNKDGQPVIITGTLYGTHFKVFADSMRKAAAEVGNNNIKIGIVLTSDNDIAGVAEVPNWNNQVLTAAGNSADFFVVHNYYTPYNQNSTPATIFNSAIAETATMMTWVKNSALLAGISQKPVALDEWNIQATGSMQNTSNIAGLDAVMVLGEILKNQFSMASRWDLANGWANGDDQGMFNIGDEPGGVEKWNARPAFYYMYYFQKYFGDRMVNSAVSGTGNADIVSYGSSFTSGQAGVILVNTAKTAHVVQVSFKNYALGTKYYYYVFNGGTDAPFSRKVYINSTGPAGVSGGPDNYAAMPAYAAATAGGILVTVPAYGAIFLVADKQ